MSPNRPGLGGELRIQGCVHAGGHRHGGVGRRESRPHELHDVAPRGGGESEAAVGGRGRRKRRVLQADACPGAAIRGRPRPSNLTDDGAEVALRGGGEHQASCVVVLARGQRDPHRYVGEAKQAGLEPPRPREDVVQQESPGEPVGHADITRLGVGRRVDGDQTNAGGPESVRILEARGEGEGHPHPAGTRVEHDLVGQGRLRAKLDADARVGRRPEAPERERQVVETRRRIQAESAVIPREGERGRAHHLDANARVAIIGGALEARASDDRPQRPFVDRNREIGHRDGLPDADHRGRRGCEVTRECQLHGVRTGDNVVHPVAALGVGRDLRHDRLIRREVPQDEPGRHEHRRVDVLGHDHAPENGSGGLLGGGRLRVEGIGGGDVCASEKECRHHQGQEPPRNAAHAVSVTGEPIRQGYMRDGRTASRRPLAGR